MTAASRTRPNSVRLFIALWPTAQTRRALRECADAWSWSGAASRVPPDRWHITLHFLGSVPRLRLSQLALGLKLPMRPFTLSLDRIDMWPKGVAVLRPQRLPLALRQLHAGLGRALRRLGLRTEARAFRPHVTLARRAGGSTPPVRVPRVSWRAQGYVLVESRRAPSVRYRVLQRY
jgi:2'-5' RNA ligase